MKRSIQAGKVDNETKRIFLKNDQFLTYYANGMHIQFSKVGSLPLI
jgi:hypothetical protein